MRRRKWLARAALALLAVISADLAANGLLRTARVKRALAARLGTAFGRPVEVAHFALSLFPNPTLEAAGVTVSEDPAFGYEYFLRAERVALGLRWSGLLRGRIEFGTFSFTRPSLNLVRDFSGRWNLDRWLPPAHRESPAPAGSAPGASAPMGPAPPPPLPIRLNFVEFDDGRVNFKRDADKLPFAFTQVSGRVEQVAPGRWTLELQARPWRSGTLLQAAGRLFVSGDIAGTSARLQPAEIRVHWGEASLADLMRLFRGQDFGFRGAVTLDAVARSGGAAGASGVTTPPANLVSAPGEWAFHVEARARRIHRWDLSERADNPALNLLLDGRWNIGSNEFRLAPVTLEAPHSNARGEASYSTAPPPSFEVRLNSAGIQAADLLAWYRAFNTGVAEGLTAEGILNATATLTGWPLQLQNAAFSSLGAILRVPGLTKPVRVGAFQGGRTRNRLELGPFWISLGALPREDPAAAMGRIGQTREGKSGIETPQNSLLASAEHDFGKARGTFTFFGRFDRAEDLLIGTAALGRPLQHGWELTGPAAGFVSWIWHENPGDAKLAGNLHFSKAELHVAGLNLPVALNDAQLIWEDEMRRVSLRSVEAFGADWSGEIQRQGQFEVTGAPDDAARWKFNLHAHHLNAAEFDRWAGPRARPGWLDRLLQSFSGNAPQESAAKVTASELLRRLRAEGEIRVDDLSVEKISLRNFSAKAVLADLRLTVHDAAAEYSGGSVRGALSANFSPIPRYAVDARLEKIQLGGLLSGAASADDPPGPWDARIAVEVHLTTEGVGRDDLWGNLAGRGRLQLRGVSLRGWNVSASLSEGALQQGVSQWTAGEGEFSVGKNEIALQSFRLTSGNEKTLLRGTLSFARDADLELSAAPLKKNSNARVLRIRGAMAAPRVSLERPQ